MYKMDESVELVGNNWLCIKLGILLPNINNRIEVRTVTNTIRNLLDDYRDYYGMLPQYEDVFVAIIEHRNSEYGGIYDHDNKGFRAVPNALKGRLLGDDNQFEMSLGLFARQSAEEYGTEIYVLPMADLSYFAENYLMV